MVCDSHTIDTSSAVCVIELTEPTNGQNGSGENAGSRQTLYAFGRRVSLTIRSLRLVEHGEKLQLLFRH